MLECGYETDPHISCDSAIQVLLRCCDHVSIQYIFTRKTFVHTKTRQSYDRDDSKRAVFFMFLFFVFFGDATYN